MTEKGNQGAAPDAEPCRDMVRQMDYERYLTTLFAPRRARPALWSLLAFNLEIARTREIVSEAMIGHIRLQWWREVLEAAAGDGPVRAHEVVEPLTAAIRSGRLPVPLLAEMIDGRERDLDDHPMETMDDLLAYADKTGGALAEAMRVAADLRAIDEAARRAARNLGRGWALTGLLRAAGFHAAQGRQFIPRLLLGASGANLRDVLERRNSPGVRDAVAQIVGAARMELEPVTAVGGATGAVFLLKPVASAYLQRLEKTEFTVFHTDWQLSPAGLMNRMVKARWLGRGMAG